MSRATLGVIDPTITSGTTLAVLLNNRTNAENSGHSGPVGTRPSYAQSGMIYTDDQTPPSLWLAVGAGPTQSLDINLTTLFNPRPGTIRHTAEVRLPTGWLWCDGSTVARITYPALFDAICPPFTGTVTSGSNVISGISAADSLDKLGVIGAAIEAPGVTGRTVTATAPTTITFSGVAATATVAGGACRVLPHGGSGTTFNLPNSKGRSIIARSDMNGIDSGLITVAGSGVDGTKIGAVGGIQSIAIGIPNLPAHSHTAGTSIHAGSVVVSQDGAHGHNISGTAAAAGGHAHGPAGTATGFIVIGPGGGSNLIGGSVTGSRATTDTFPNHAHNVAGSTISQSPATHTHTITMAFDTTVDVGPATAIGTPLPNLSPSIIENAVIKW